MNRDEALEKVFKCDGFNSGVNYKEHLSDGVWILRSDVLNFVSKIFDDFENRSCENCKNMYIHFDREKDHIQNNACELGISSSSDGWIKKDFYCKEWEAKQ